MVNKAFIPINVINTKHNYKYSIMLYNYENGIKKSIQGVKSIYTFSSLTTYGVDITSAFLGVSIKDVIKFIKIK